MLIRTWQERCGININQDADTLSHWTIRRVMQAEIDDLRLAVRQLQLIVEVASRVSAAWESESDDIQQNDLSVAECCESLDKLNQVLREWQGRSG